MRERRKKRRKSKRKRKRIEKDVKAREERTRNGKRMIPVTNREDGGTQSNIIRSTDRALDSLELLNKIVYSLLNRAGNEMGMTKKKGGGEGWRVTDPLQRG